MISHAPGHQKDKDLGVEALLFPIEKTMVNKTMGLMKMPKIWIEIKKGSTGIEKEIEGMMLKVQEEWIEVMMIGLMMGIMMATTEIEGTAIEIVTAEKNDLTVLE